MKKETVIVEKHIDRGLGFPVEIHDAPIVTFGDDKYLDVSPEDIAEAVYKQLPQYEGRLTGNHIRFIRYQSRMTQAQFAERFGVTQPAVIKWEKKGNKPTDMAWSAEKDIRMFIVVRTVKSAEKFRRIYEKLAEVPGGKARPFVYRVNAKKKLVAA